MIWEPGWMSSAPAFPLTFSMVFACFDVCWCGWICPKLPISAVTTQAFRAFVSIGDPCDWFGFFWGVMQQCVSLSMESFYPVLFKCRSWASLKYWLLPTDGDIVWKKLWLESVLFPVLSCLWTGNLIYWICHALLQSGSSCTDAQLYKMPGATKAHRERAAVPQSLQ